MSQSYGKQRISPRKRFLAVHIIRVADAGMTNSLVACNVDISEALSRYLKFMISQGKIVKKQTFFPLEFLFKKSLFSTIQ